MVACVISSFNFLMLKLLTPIALTNPSLTRSATADQVSASGGDTSGPGRPVTGQWTYTGGGTDSKAH